MDLFGFQLSGKKLVPQYVKFTVNVSFLFYVASFHYHLLSTRVLPTRRYRSLPCNCGQAKIVQMITPSYRWFKNEHEEKIYVLMHAAFKMMANNTTACSDRVFKGLQRPRSLSLCYICLFLSACCIVSTVRTWVSLLFTDAILAPHTVHDT